MGKMGIPRESKRDQISVATQERVVKTNYLLDHDEDDDAFQRDFSIEAANLSRRNLLVGRSGTKAASHTAGSQRRVARAHWILDSQVRQTLNFHLPECRCAGAMFAVVIFMVSAMASPSRCQLVGSRRLQEGPGSGGVLLDVVGTSRVREYGWSMPHETALDRLCAGAVFEGAREVLGASSEAVVGTLPPSFHVHDGFCGHTNSGGALLEVVGTASKDTPSHSTVNAIFELKVESGLREDG
ncbi:hypothetical protein DFP72DRAFT_844840 [Ephemerocybe angulata]|uniref:Uncharacterized protein n=1 Tax=Ephemerocybe angulata TaxID=980116 RepID=A0A8H6MAW7_9AGAR|nr:hypothetical protein DFP72DRAFT_844840 [Tulosesus angulatus]